MLQKTFQQILADKLKPQSPSWSTTSFRSETHSPAENSEDIKTSKTAIQGSTLTTEQLLLSSFSIKLEAPRRAHISKSKAYAKHLGSGQAPVCDTPLRAPTAPTPHILTPEQALALKFFQNHTSLSPAFTPKELKTRFRQLVKRLHPDQGGTAMDFLNLQAAYRELSLLF